MTELSTVDDAAVALTAIAEGFHDGGTHPFAFGDNGVPEAVITTYEQYSDLRGEEKLGRNPRSLTTADLGRRLPELVEAIRHNTFGAPVFCADGSTPELVILSTSQYRMLRGDDEPPPGTPDDPTERTYATRPLPDSRPFDLDRWAAGDPFTQDLLTDLRRDPNTTDPSGDR